MPTSGCRKPLEQKVLGYFWPSMAIMLPEAPAALPNVIPVLTLAGAGSVSVVEHQLIVCRRLTYVALPEMVNGTIPPFPVRARLESSVKHSPVSPLSDHFIIRLAKSPTRSSLFLVFRARVRKSCLRDEPRASPFWIVVRLPFVC
jgi:hypothetical protein